MINRRLIPIKAHYFFFLGCLSPIFPFMMVFAQQLGIPVIVQGTLGSIMLVVTVFFKPLVAGLADTFPNFRKKIFVLIISIMIVALSGIGHLPPMHVRFKKIVMNGSLLPQNFDIHLYLQDNKSNSITRESLTNETLSYFSSEKADDCFPQELWDCFSSNFVPIDESIYKFSKSVIVVSKMKLINKESRLVYSLSGTNFSSLKYMQTLSFECKGALYTGEGCESLFQKWAFWIYFVLFLLGFFMYATANSISDAVCIDTIGPKGDFGNQRAWGTVGWGIMGPISGLLVDWMSGTNVIKNYSPAFLILLIFGSINIIIIVTSLKVPKFDKKTDVWKMLRPLLKKPGFVVFLFFTILAGSFDGVIASYIFM